MYPSNKNEKHDNSITSQGGGDGIPKSQGGGDGVPKSASKKRTAIPSARKCNVKAKDDSLKLKLDGDLNMENEKEKITIKGCVRSASMAEITPTRSLVKKKIRHTMAAGAGDAVSNSTSSTATLYTPRPLDGAEPFQKKCSRERFSCAIYRQLMLLAWRKTKKHHAKIADLLLERNDEVNQLERQNGVLNDLRKSEEQKRTEALIENQKMRKIIEALDFANINLTEENKNIKKCIDNFQSNLSVATENIAILNDKAKKMQEQLKKKSEEKKILEDKNILQEKELYSQKVILSHMQDTVKNTERYLKETDSNLKFKCKKYSLLKQEFKRQQDEIASLTINLKEKENELNRVNTENKNLESKLQEFENSCTNLKEENELLRFEVKEMTLELEEEKLKSWFKNTKDFALLSISAMHKIALIMLPAYREF